MDKFHPWIVCREKLNDRKRMKYPQRFLIVFLWLLLACSMLTCCVFGVIGAQGYFSEFKTPYSTEMHAELLGYQLIGPIYTLLFGSFLAFLLFRGKRVSGWLWLLALIGPVYTTKAVDKFSHDLSHVVFHECSGIYGTWFLGLSVVSGVCLLGMGFLSFKLRLRGGPHVRNP